MKAVFLLNRCRSYGEDMDKLRDERIRREKIQAACDGVDMAEEIEAIKERAKVRRREYKAEVKAVTVMLDGLPDITAKVMHAFYVDGYSYAVIAEKMQYGVGNIRKHVYNGRQRLGRMTHAEVLRLVPDWYAEKYAREVE